MDIKPLTWLVAISAFVAVAAAHAEGGYIFAGVGPSFTEDVSGSVGGAPFRETYDTGYMVHGGTGYRVGPYRLEGEMVYAQHPLNRVAPGDIPGSSGGDRSTLAGLANFYVDFDTTTRWIPYVGAGIGIASVALNDIWASPSIVLNDSDIVFAFQLKAGISYTVGTATQLSIGYRFFSADDPDLEEVDGLEVTSEGSQLHTLEAGLRYRF